jgi:hypothetical protein
MGLPPWVAKPKGERINISGTKIDLQREKSWVFELNKRKFNKLL